MRRLAVLSNPILVQELLSQLQEARIPATKTTEAGPAELQLGGDRFVVWIQSDADAALAAGIVQGLVFPATSSSCPRCGYQLAGHSGSVGCPECGCSVTAPVHSIRCERCGEPVPSNFDMCWSCEHPLPEGAHAVVPEPLAGDQSRRARSTFVIGFLAVAVATVLGFIGGLGGFSPIFGLAVGLFITYLMKRAARGTSL